MRRARSLVVLFLGAALALGSAGSADVTTVGGTVQVQPLWIDLTLRDTHVATGERIHLTATVTNRGQVHLRNLHIELRHPDPTLLIHPPHEQHHPNLHPGRSHSVHWQGCAEHPGSYGMLARAEFETADGRRIIAESPTRIVHVDRAGHRPCR